MMAKKVKSFMVTTKLNIDCSINIKAESLEDAVQQTLGLRENDFVDIYGDYMDGDMRVTGVLENDE